MAEHSAIAWTRSTFNPLIGCTKVGPGCDHCYAEALDNRHRWKGATHWGVGVPRMRTADSNWLKVERWNRFAAEEKLTGELTPKSEWKGRVGFWPVFCASLADVFDNEVHDLWRTDLFALILATPHLSWLLVTKRIGNVAKMVPANWLSDGFPPHVRVLITVVNQEEADRDVPKLLALPCKNGISYEPALGPVDWSRWIWPMCWHWAAGYKTPEEAIAAGAYAELKPQGLVSAHRKFIEWIIVGGESTQGAPARPFDLGWAYSTIKQCRSSKVPVFVKQLGANPYFGIAPIDKPKDRAGADEAEWPEELRVQEFPA